MDRTLFFLINREWTNPALDRFMAVLTDFNVWFVPTLVLMVAVWLKGRFRARAFLVMAALAVGVNDGIIARTLKRMTDRPRPHQMLAGVRQVELGRDTVGLLRVSQPLRIKASKAATRPVAGRSFPSGHTINSFSVAFVCIAFYRRRAWLTLIPAALVGYSRIYTGSHWPTDVAISVLIAFGMTCLLIALSEWLWPHIAARFAPHLLEKHPTLVPR